MELPKPSHLDTECGRRLNGGMLTVRHLIGSFLAQMAVRVKCEQTEQKTLDWYTHGLAPLAAVNDFPAADLRAHHLVSIKFTNHFVRSIKALYRWAADEDVQLVPRDPFRKLSTPQCGERNRVLTRDEMLKLYLASGRQFRRFLFVLSRTIARPGEIRGLKWGDINWDRRLILLVKFKGKKRRRDGMKVRSIPLDRPAARLLRNMHERAGRPGPDAHVWIGKRGKQWTSNALRCQMRRARCQAGLDLEGVERVVCYTLRHTEATNATRSGMVMQTLCRIMGQTRTTTTDRYLHLAGDDLVNAIDSKAARRGK